MTAKEGDMGTRAYAVYMQFLWTAVGAGTKGVIKILQINYTKKKKANYLYTKSVQGLHFAVIICTNSAGKRGRKRSAVTLYLRDKV